MVGLDVSDRSIKAVEVSDGDSPKLKAVCWSSVAPNLMRRGIVQDPTMVAATIMEALTKCTPVPVAGRKVVVSIPETQSFVRVIDLPMMREEEMDEAVQWAIRHHIPFDLDRVYLDWQPLSQVQGEERVQVLVGAAQRDVIDPLLQVLDSAGLQVMALELEAQAIVRSLLPRDSESISGVLLVDLGATSTNVIYFDRGTMRFTTSIQRGGDDLTQQLAQELKLEPSIAAEKKAQVGVQGTTTDGNIAQTLRVVTLDLTQQIERVVREVLSQMSLNEGIRAIMLAGGASNLPGLQEIFGEVFPGVPVQLGNPLINLMGEATGQEFALSAADAVHFTTAIGLALRRPDFNLTLKP